MEPREKVLGQELSKPLSAVPTSFSASAVDKWLTKHKSQFKGKANEFKKHVAQVTAVLQAFDATKQDLVDTAIKYRLHEKHAGRMPVNNLSTYYAASHFEAA